MLGGVDDPWVKYCSGRKGRSEVAAGTLIVNVTFPASLFAMQMYIPRSTSPKLNFLRSSLLVAFYLPVLFVLLVQCGSRMSAPYVFLVRRMTSHLFLSVGFTFTPKPTPRFYPSTSLQPPRISDSVLPVCLPTMQMYIPRSRSSALNDSIDSVPSFSASVSSDGWDESESKSESVSG